MIVFMYVCPFPYVTVYVYGNARLCVWIHFVKSETCFLQPFYLLTAYCHHQFHSTAPVHLASSRNLLEAVTHKLTSFTQSTHLIDHVWSEFGRADWNTAGPWGPKPNAKTQSRLSSLHSSNSPNCLNRRFPFQICSLKISLGVSVFKIQLGILRLFNNFAHAYNFLLSHCLVVNRLKLLMGISGEENIKNKTNGLLLESIGRMWYVLIFLAQCVLLSFSITHILIIIVKGSRSQAPSYRWAKR